MATHFNYKLAQIRKKSSQVLSHARVTNQITRFHVKYGKYSMLKVNFLINLFVGAHLNFW